MRGAHVFSWGVQTEGKEESYVRRGIRWDNEGRRVREGTHQQEYAEGGTVRPSELVWQGENVGKPKERERLKGTR